MNQGRSNPKLKALLFLVLGLATFALYSSSLKQRFLAYDDQQYVTENTHVQAGLSWEGAVWAFKSFHATNWHPVTWLSHMLDCRLYGLRPAGHHLTNLLLHTANALLLFFLLCRMTGGPWQSFAVAALFAWHPLHVESVAWVAERKDVLSALFWMLSLLAYVSYVEAPGPGCEDSNDGRILHEEVGRIPPRTSMTLRVKPLGTRGWFFYTLALFWFALGVMSKPMVVTLPFVLLLLDFWPLARFRGSSSQGKRAASLVLEKLPFLILSGVGCALTLWAQEQAMVSTAGLRVSERVGHALTAYVHYVVMMLVPRHLAVFYPYNRGEFAGAIVLAGALLALTTTLLIYLARRLPYLAVGWLWFLGTLVPVIGLVQVGEQAWADRYTYLPSIGFFVMLVWGVSELAGRVRAVRMGLPWIGVATGVACLIGTSVQLRYWKDTRTLFEHVDRVTRNNPLSTTLLGSLLANEGKYGQAIDYYRRALSYSPGFPEAHFYLGHAFDQQGNLDEAISEYEKAVWFKPIQEQTHIRLGVAMAKQQKLEQAEAHYRAALKVNPESAIAHNNLAKLFHSQGRLAEAIVHYSAALKCDPTLAQAHNNLGVLFIQTGRVAEGIAQLRNALQLKPNDPESQLNLAQGLVKQEQWGEAADLFAKTVTPATADPNVHYQFATALAHLRQTRSAMGQYANALLLQQDFPAALDGLAWILATDADPQVRNGDQAYAMAERACTLTGRKDPEKLKTLAAACAETGRFSQALFDAQAALDLANKNGQREVADECRLMLQAFRAGKPWRDPQQRMKSVHATRLAPAG